MRVVMRFEPGRKRGQVVVEFVEEDLDSRQGRQLTSATKHRAHEQPIAFESYHLVDSGAEYEFKIREEDQVQLIASRRKNF